MVDKQLTVIYVEYSTICMNSLFPSRLKCKCDAHANNWECIVLKL